MDVISHVFTAGVTFNNAVTLKQVPLIGCSVVSKPTFTLCINLCRLQGKRLPALDKMWILNISSISTTLPLPIRHQIVKLHVCNVAAVLKTLCNGFSKAVLVRRSVMGEKWEETGSMREHMWAYVVSGRGECLKTGTARWYSAEAIALLLEGNFFALFDIQHLSDAWIYQLNSKKRRPKAFERRMDAPWNEAGCLSLNDKEFSLRWTPYSIQVSSFPYRVPFLKASVTKEVSKQRPRSNISYCSARSTLWSEAASNVESLFMAVVYFQEKYTSSAETVSQWGEWQKITNAKYFMVNCLFTQIYCFSWILWLTFWTPLCFGQAI